MARLSRAEQNREEAAKFSELAKTASSPFLRAYYWHAALRYLSSDGELSVSEHKLPLALQKRSEEFGRSPLTCLRKAIDQAARDDGQVRTLTIGSIASPRPAAPRRQPGCSQVMVPVQSTREVLPMRWCCRRIFVRK
jgi:hypothetical protein